MKDKIFNFFFEKCKNNPISVLTIKTEKRQIEKTHREFCDRSIESNSQNCMSKYFNGLKGLNFYERNGYHNQNVLAKRSLSNVYNRREYPLSDGFCLR